MYGLAWFWILTSVGIMLFLIQAGFALIMRAERSGKKEEVGSVLADDLVFDPDKNLFKFKDKPKRKKK